VPALDVLIFMSWLGRVSCECVALALSSTSVCEGVCLCYLEFVLSLFLTTSILHTHSSIKLGSLVTVEIIVSVLTAMLESEC